jgi:hypothetical protein
MLTISPLYASLAPRSWGERLAWARLSATARSLVRRHHANGRNAFVNGREAGGTPSAERLRCLWLPNRSSRTDAHLTHSLVFHADTSVRQRPPVCSATMASLLHNARSLPLKGADETRLFREARSRCDMSREPSSTKRAGSAASREGAGHCQALTLLRHGHAVAAVSACSA